MPASNTDKLRKGFYGPATVLSAEIDDTDVTIPLENTTDWPADTAIDIVIDRVDASGTETPDKAETVTVVISGTNGTTAIRGREGTAQSHAVGAVVEVLYTAATRNDEVDAFLEEHKQDGSHKDVVADSFSDSRGVLMPTGSVVDYAGATAPSGWLLCYGQSVAKDTYPELYDAVGDTYGSTATHFTIPDLRGRVIAGQDDMGGTSANRLTGLSGGVNGDTLGASGGAESHTLTEGQMPAHTHNYTAGGSVKLEGGGASFSPLLNSGTSTTTSAGSGEAHNNVQPTFVLNKIIKT